MNGHNLAPISELTLTLVKSVLGRGPLHECEFAALNGKPHFATEDHEAAWPEEVIEALAAKGCVTIEGDKGRRIVRLLS